jgi:hypothetical protein
MRAGLLRTASSAASAAYWAAGTGFSSLRVDAGFQTRHAAVKCLQALRESFTSRSYLAQCDGVSTDSGPHRAYNPASEQSGSS